MRRTTVIVLLSLGFSCAAWAQLQVVAVPADPNDPSVPHQVHSGAPITLKAILRGPGYNYRVWWDVNRNNNFDDDHSRDVSRNSITQSVWDIGRSYQAPIVTEGTRMDIAVRVRCLSTAQNVYGVYRIYVHPWTPNNDPRLWTDEQIVIMREMAAQESLWYLHRRMGSFSGAPNNSQLLGSIGSGQSNASILRAFVEKGRYPAYPPNTINTQGLTLPSGWTEQNEFRWATDPYAETTVRLLNYISGFMRTQTISAADEDNTNGYSGFQTPTYASRIPGTTDGIGYYMDFYYESGGTVGATGVSLAAYAACLPVLAGTPPQRLGGSISLTQPWEFYVQQMVDWVGFAQTDGGSNLGGWGATPNTGTWSMHSSAWCYWGLMDAQRYGTPHGVIVNNRHKYRCAQALMTIQNPDGGIERYGTSSISSNNSVGAALLLTAWQGWNTFPRDNVVPYQEVNYTRAQLRDLRDRFIAYAQARWTTSDLRDQSGYPAGFWRNGDFLCGVLSGAHNITPREGNIYGMFWHGMAFRTLDPPIPGFGYHDWSRQFSTYLIRSQARIANPSAPLEGYASFGHLDEDAWGSYYPWSRVYYPPEWGTALAAIILTPPTYDPPPVAAGAVTPNTVTEGCMGSGAGQVALTHDTSFHPSHSHAIVTYQWDIDNSDGYSWDSGAADYETDDPNQSFTHTYLAPGTYVATLRVVDDSDTPRVDSESFTVTVAPAANEAPVVNAGGPYTIHWGEELVLDGAVSDPNIPCGDTVTTTWDLNGNAVFGDATGEAPTVPWGPPLDALPVNTEITIILRATDSGGLVSEDESQLTVVNDPPSDITTTGLIVQSATTDDALVGTLFAVDTEGGPTPFVWSFAAPNHDADGRFKLANPSGDAIEVLVADASRIDDTVSEYAISVSVQDNLGAAIASPVNFIITVDDNTPPTAVISLVGASPTTADALVFSVQFSESVGDSFGASEVSLAVGSLSGVIDVAGADDLYSVTISLTDPNANGEVGIEIEGGAVSDGRGNYYAGGASPLYTVYNWPGFSSEPANAKRYVGDACLFSVSAAYGPITPSFEWWFENDAKTATLVGAEEHLLIDPVSQEDAGNYWCEVYYDGATYSSGVAALEVTEALVIVTQPEGAIRRVGDSHSFTVSTTGGFSPLTYTWKHNDDPVGWDADYTIDDIALSHAGIYTVEVLDAYEDMAISSDALLEVETPAPATTMYGITLLIVALAAGAMGLLQERRR